MDREIIRARENNYDELVDQATHPFATQEEIDELGWWFEHFSNNEYWNGEYHKVDKNYNLYPVYELDEDGEVKTTHWQLR